MKRFARTSLGGAVLIAFTGTASNALPSTPHEQAMAFAICSGRFEAMATRQKALKLPEAHESASIQGDFEMLLEATLPAAFEYGVPKTEPLHWRVGGWSEIANLLATTSYSSDESRVIAAQIRMERRLEDCRSMILG